MTCLFQLAVDEPAPAAHPAAERGNQDSPACGTLGPFELLEEIGRGGMGVIYRARRARTAELLAVKVLLPTREDAAEARARFEREARAIATLHHPHVMPVHDVFLDAEMPYFSMDFAPGGSLADILPKYRGRWRQASRLMVQVAEAVHYAHRQNLLHRDLKPGNILFTDDYQPLVSDFGLAKWLDESGPALTRSLVMFGTPNYVAPEQAAGKHGEMTPATDIYSLGAIFFELLTGRPPFVGDSPLDVLHQTLHDTAPRVRLVAPAVPAGLETICIRCLAKAPGDRYSSAQELADDIGRWLQGRKLQQLPRFTGWWSRTKADPRILRLSIVVSATIGVAALACVAVRSARNAESFPSRSAGFPAMDLRVDDLSDDGSLKPFSDRFVSAAVRAGVGAEQVRTAQVRRVAVESAGDNRRGDDPASGRSWVLHESLRIVNSRIRIVSTLTRPGAAQPMLVRADTLPLLPTDKELATLVRAVVKEMAASLGGVTQSQGETGEPSPMGSEADSYAKKAFELFARGTFDENEHAIDLYQRALKLRANDFRALAGLSNAYRIKYDWWHDDERWLTAARDSAHRALELDPLSPEAHHAMGCCDLAANLYPEAREEFLQEVEVNPGLAAGNGFVGICWREAGDPRRALPWLLRAVRLDTIHGAFNMVLGENQMLLGDDHGAERQFERALEIDPELPNARSALAILKLWQGKWNDAQAMSNELSTRFPNYPYKDELAAEVAFFSGQSAAALERYDQLAARLSYNRGWEYFGAVNPLSATAYLLLEKGDPTTAQQKIDEAQAVDEQLLAKHPNNSRLLHDLAANSALRGDSSKAIEMLLQARAAGWVEDRSTQVDPRFRSISGDPRFIAFAHQTVPAVILP